MGGLLLLLSCLPTGEVRADESDTLPLPKWVLPRGHGLPTGVPDSNALGGGLLPRADGTVDETPEAVPATPAENAKPSGDGFATNFFKLFIPQPQTQVLPALPAKNQTQPVSMEVLRTTFKSDKQVYFLDPQQLITETQTEDLRRLLSDHAGGAKVAIYLLVLAPGQALPDKCDLGQIASGALLNRLSCLVVYPLKEPWRARLFTSREVDEIASSNYLSVLAQDCIKDSMRASEEVEQLQRFVTQLSIRLFWLERTFPIPVRSLVQASPAISPLPGAAKELLPEVETRPEMRNSFDAIVRRWWPVLYHSGIALLMLLLGILVCRALYRRRLRRLAQSVWVLPEGDPETTDRRLGAAHCGGCGAMIRYGG